LDLVRRRVKKEIRQQGLLRGKKRIGIAVSGGKDSIVLLTLLNEIIDPVRGGALIPITIDEGIEGYRPSAVNISRNITSELGLEGHVHSFMDLFGMNLDTMVRRSEKGPCTICGMLRRKALNIACRELGCDKLATGHNLDDMAQTILMNIMSADLQRIARLGPHIEPVPGFIPRVFPIRSTTETETYLTAHLLGLPIHDMECPYAVSAKRGAFREMLMTAERETPGTRHSLLRFHEQISPLIPKGEPGGLECRRCGDPIFSSNDGDLCTPCKLLQELEAEI
jgi:uncharacterized protein (TIGR00269 family)